MASQVGRDPLLGWYQASSVQLLLQAGGLLEEGGARLCQKWGRESILASLSLYNMSAQMQWLQTTYIYNLVIQQYRNPKWVSLG